MPAVRTMVQVKSLKLTVTTRSPSYIFSLPDDILLLIIGFVGVKEILTLRQTSKRFYSMTKLRWVWSNAVKKHVIDKGLPVPAADGMKEFSAVDLEARAVHAAKLHENWYSAKPTPRKTISFKMDASVPDFFSVVRPAVKQVLFLPGRNGQFLVTVGTRTVTCWEVPLDGAAAYQIAEWHSDMMVERVIVNEDPKSSATLACICGDPLQTASHVDLHVLTLDSFHGKLLPRAALRANRSVAFPLHAMRGDWIAFGDPLLIWHMPSVNPIRARNINDESKVLTAKFIGKYLLVVRQSSVHVLGYDQTDGDGNPAIPSHSAGLAYAAKEAVVVSRMPNVASEQGRTDWPSEPVSIIMRCCDDGFDTIRQYDLPPNPKIKSFTPNLGNNLEQYPCLFPMHYADTLGVAPSACTLTAGQNGKGFWIETRNVMSRRSVFPARCLVGFDVTKKEGKLVLCGSVDGESNELHVSKNELYARRCDMSEILCKRYMMLSADLEDSVGRVAVGYRTGVVEVLDFVG